MSPELAVLTSMITPAVLISACGALILSTSVRLGRVVDRVRVLSDRFEDLAHKPEAEVVLPPSLPLHPRAERRRERAPHRRSESGPVQRHGLEEPARRRGIE